MRFRTIAYRLQFAFVLLLLGLSAMQAQAAVQKQRFSTRSGIVVVGYGPVTNG